MARLSLCVIARDEERMLPGCLASVAGAVDEVVVLDTGSRDRTAELARAAGARVVAWAWQDDFAAARNEAQRHATGDFVLVLDADERLAPGAGAALRAGLLEPGWDAALLAKHDAASPAEPVEAVVAGRGRIGAPVLEVRLYRLAGAPRWRGVVHENLSAWIEERGRRLRRVEADVVHLGNAPSVRLERRKNERNLALLRRRAAEDPSDPSTYGYLATELLEAGDVEGAAAAAEAGWRVASDPSRNLRRLAAARALAALARGDAALALETADAAIAREGERADLLFLRGCALEALALAGAAQAAGAVRAFARAIAIEDRADTERVVAGASGATLRARLGEAQLLAGLAAEARASFEDALRRDPAHPIARVGHAEALVATGDAAGALAEVEGVLGDEPDGWVVAALAADALGAASESRLLVLRAVERARRGFASERRRRRLAALLVTSPGGTPR